MTKTTQASQPTLDGKSTRFIQEYDDKGNHRIVWVPPTGARRFGEWTNYRNIATLNHAGKSAIAVSTYFNGTALNPGTIYFVEVQ